MVKILNLSKKTRYGNQLNFFGFVTIIQLVFNSSFARICHSIMIKHKMYQSYTYLKQNRCICL